METQALLGEASIIRSRDFVFVPEPGSAVTVATPVSPELGAQLVTLNVVRLPAGSIWSPPQTTAQENVAVIYAGAGFATAGEDNRAVARGDAVYAPAGRALTLSAGAGGLTAYLWRAPLMADRTVPAGADAYSSLWNETTQLRNFAGMGKEVIPPEQRATMNFVFWPGTGSCQMCLHCGVQQPGETFSVHLHTHSDEAFIAFEGVGQMYLADHWVDVEAGDVLFAQPMVLHGARNPHTGPDAQRFVTCGGPIPWDAFLYDAAGVSCDVRGN